MSPLMPPANSPATRATSKIPMAMKVDRMICPRLVNLRAVLPEGWPNGPALAAALRYGIALGIVGALLGIPRPLSIRCTSPTYSTFAI
jgi:hypothetical protein